MRKTKIVVPIMLTELTELEKVSVSDYHSADIVEWRADFLSADDIFEMAPKFFEKFKESKILFTLRTVREGGNIQVSEKKYLQILKEIFYSITAICVGYILYVSGMLPEIEYPYFNGMIFLLAEGLVICYGTLNSIFYRKSWEPLVQASRNTGFVVVFELFLLAATGQLELVEGVVGLFALSLSGVIPLAVENGEEEEEISVETDYPNPDLFAARRRQLKQFGRVLEQQA